MLSVLSGTTASYPLCPVRSFYGMTAQRRSRNMAVLGMFGVMTLTAALCMALHAERTLSLPALQPRRVNLVQPQFRFVYEQKAEKPEMEKILTEESTFEIPEEEVPKIEPEPEKLPQKTEPEPEIKPEPQKAPVSRPAPKPKSKPKPKPKPVPALPKSALKPDSTPKSAATPAEGTSSVNTVSKPGAAGNIEKENSRQREALAAILQAVEKHKRYPRQGRRSGAEGTCTLAVQIGAEGRVLSCTLVERSGHAVLDVASKRLGEKLLGLYVGSPGSLKVLVPVHYRLTE